MLLFRHIRGKRGTIDKQQIKVFLRCGVWAKRYWVSFLFAYIARVIGFILAVVVYGWDADPPSFAITFQCVFSFVLIFGISVISFLSEFVFEKLLRLPITIQCVLLLGIYLILGTGYVGIVFSSSDFTWRPVVVFAGLSDIVIPGMIFSISRFLPKHNNS
jgi:hypothetical protein